jgi:hypothetical protein
MERTKCIEKYSGDFFDKKTVILPHFTSILSQLTYSEKNPTIGKHTAQKILKQLG